MLKTLCMIMKKLRLDEVGNGQQMLFRLETMLIFMLTMAHMKLFGLCQLIKGCTQFKHHSPMVAIMSMLKGMLCCLGCQWLSNFILGKPINSYPSKKIWKTLQFIIICVFSISCTNFSQLLNMYNGIIIVMILRQLNAQNINRYEIGPCPIPLE